MTWKKKACFEMFSHQSQNVLTVTNHKMSLPKTYRLATSNRQRDNLTHGSFLKIGKTRLDAFFLIVSKFCLDGVWRACAEVFWFGLLGSCLFGSSDILCLLLQGLQGL